MRFWGSGNPGLGDGSLDEAVDALDEPVADLAEPPVEDPPPVLLECGGHTHQGGDPASVGQGAPVVYEHGA